MLAAVDAIDERVLALEEARSEAANLRAGLIAATLINLKLKKGAKKVRPRDFFYKPAKPQTVEEMAQTLDRLIARQNRERSS